MVSLLHLLWLMVDTVLWTSLWLWLNAQRQPAPASLYFLQLGKEEENRALTLLSTRSPHFSCPWSGWCPGVWLRAGAPAGGVANCPGSLSSGSTSCCSSLGAGAGATTGTVSPGAGLPQRGFPCSPGISCLDFGHHFVCLTCCSRGDVHGMCYHLCRVAFTALKTQQCSRHVPATAMKWCGDGAVCLSHSWYSLHGEGTGAWWVEEGTCPFARC